MKLSVEIKTGLDPLIMKYFVVLVWHMYSTKFSMCMCIHGGVYTALQHSTHVRTGTKFRNLVLVYRYAVACGFWHNTRRTVCMLISEGSFWVTHCHQKCVRKEISRSGFLDVNRQGFRNSIDLRRVFLRYVNISTRIVDHSVSCPGLYGGLWVVWWAESPIQI